MKKILVLIICLMIALFFDASLCNAKEKCDNLKDYSDIKIKNVGFENGLASWAPPNPAVCKTSISTEKSHNGKKSVRIQDDTGVTWCLVQRLATVAPGKYEVEIHCLLDGGRAFLWIESLDRKNKVIASKRSEIISSQMLNPLVPDFVPPRFVRGYEKRGWQVLKAEIEVKQSEKLRIRFGSYFMPSIMYFDDLSIKKIIK